MVREAGVEPAWVSPLDPKSSASASSATLAALFQGFFLTAFLSFCILTTVLTTDIRKKVAACVTRQPIVHHN